MHGLPVDQIEGKFVETLGTKFADKLVEFKPDILFFSLASTPIRRSRWLAR